MPGIRNAVVGIALGSALLTQPLHAASPSNGPPEPDTPPAERAEYIAQVKAADKVPGDEARCKAHPDLPGNQWRPGAAQGRCSVLRAPVYTLDQIDALLDTDEGVADLERTFTALLDAHYRDQEQREQIFIAFNVFNEDARAGEVAQRWLTAVPKSPFAMVAAGLHFGESGWNARGTKFASRTPEAQLKRMTELFAKAVPLYMQAMEVEPRLSVACTKLGAIGRQSSDALQTFAASHCLKVDPDSYYVAWEQINAAQPKWGGSDEQLRHAVAYAAARTERNPILGALLGEAAGYRPANADSYGEVVDELAGASRMGPSGTLMAQAAAGYWTKHDWWRSVVYYSQALRFWPNNANYRYNRATLMGGANDYAWARSDIEIALKQEPDNSRYLYIMGVATEALESAVAARPYFKRAMAGERRPQAMERYCQSFMIPVVLKDAEACTRNLVDEFPGSATGWYMRVWALADRDVDGALVAAQRFKALADSDDVEDRRKLDDIKGVEAVLGSQKRAPVGGVPGK